MSYLKNQCIRSGVMDRVIRSCFEASRPINGLEIGTWFGLGSTKVWMESFPFGSTLTCIDPWRPYISAQDKQHGPVHYTSMDTGMREAAISTLDVVMEHEEEPRITVNIVRARAAEFVQMFSPGQFDLVYVDGSHYYDDVVADLRQAKRLAKTQYALVCGDDLEFLPTPTHIDFAREHKYEDCVGGFHPGVLLAVAEEFSSGVHMESGFWWTIRNNGVWA